MVVRAGVLAYAVCFVVPVASSPYDPDLGDTPFFCGDDDPKCPHGYACVPSPGVPGGVCQSNALAPDARPAGTPDGAEPGGGCSDANEPNELLAEATATGIPDQTAEFEQAGLTMCSGDVDLFWFRVNVAGKTIVAVVDEGEQDGQPTRMGHGQRVAVRGN